jgi:hypothetical protein
MAKANDRYYADENATPVRCNMCWWTGREDELVRINYRADEIGKQRPFAGCPTCLTDEYLMNDFIPDAQ